MNHYVKQFVILFTGCLLLSSCFIHDDDIETLTQLTGIDIVRHIECQKKIEHFDAIDGDGYRISVYQVDASHFQEVEEDFLAKGFKPFKGDQYDVNMQHREGISKYYTISEEETFNVYLDENNQQLLCIVNVRRK